VPSGATFLPMSFSQERMWFMQQLLGETGFYNVGFALTLRGPLYRQALAEALNLLVARHEPFRTTFLDDERGRLQCIHPRLAVPLQVTPVAAATLSDREETARRIASQEINRPFDLSAGPLLRVHLYECDPTVHLLALSLHHIVGDVLSIGRFFEELGPLYA